MSDGTTLISLRRLEESYPEGPGRTFVLRQVTLDVMNGEYPSIMGRREPESRRSCTSWVCMTARGTVSICFLTNPCTRSRPNSGPSSRKRTSGSCFRAITCSTISPSTRTSRCRCYIATSSAPNASRSRAMSSTASRSLGSATSLTVNCSVGSSSLSVSNVLSSRIPSSFWPTNRPATFTPARGRRS